MSPSSASPQPLDHESLAMLLEEVSAMAASGRSLVSGLADLDDGAMGKMGRAARRVRARIEKGEAASEAMACLSDQYQTTIRIAMEVMGKTGSTKPIYETVRLIREANEDRHQIQLSVLNPMLNVIVAAAVTFLVMPWILVSISEAELIKAAFAPSAIEIFQTFAQNFALAAAATVAVIGLFAAALYWNLRRSMRGVDTCRDHATFCRWVAMRIGLSQSEDADADAAEVGHVIESAADVVGPHFANCWSGVVKNIRNGSQTAASLAFLETTPEPVRQCVVDLVTGRRDGASIALDMLRLSELYRQTSRRRRTWWIHVLPRWVSAILMIAMMVVLLRTILLPLFEVVGEVAS